MKSYRVTIIRGSLLIACIYCSLLYMSCDKDSSAPTGDGTTDTTLTVGGHVYYSGSGFEGVGVFLTVNGTLRVTQVDNKGAYSFDTINPGDTCMVRVIHEDFRFIPSLLSFVAGDTTVVLEDITAYRIHTVDNVITFKTIPGGSFDMGSNFEDSPEKPDEYNYDFSNEQPIHTVIIDDFEMSVTEITEDQFARFLTNAFAQDLIEVAIDKSDAVTELRVYATSGEYTGQLLLGHGYIGSVHGYGQDGPHNKIQINSGLFTGPVDIPVKHVTWYGAKMFAEFLGCDLPTEAEWEYACRGGKGYEYGTDTGAIDLIRANYQPEIGPPSTSPTLTVAMYPSNPFGIHDLTGNLSEWCNDYYDASYYSISPSSNPTGPVTGTYNVVRGGSYASQAVGCRASTRSGMQTNTSHKAVGFRIVRRP